MHDIVHGALRTRKNITVFTERVHKPTGFLILFRTIFFLVVFHEEFVRFMGGDGCGGRSRRTATPALAWVGRAVLLGKFARSGLALGWLQLCVWRSLALFLLCFRRRSVTSLERPGRLRPLCLL